MPQVVHSTFQGLEIHEDKRIKVPVRAASTANVSLAAPGATIDGVTLAANDRVLLKNQTTQSQNGIYVWTGAAVALTRATDANSAALLFFGFLVYVREGTANGGTLWMFTQAAAVTLETTSLTFSAVGATNLSGEMTAADFKVTGLTGATAGMRMVGATASGAPTSGTFAVGDVVEDQAAGGFWACTVAGTPGTWIRTGFANPMTTAGDLIVGGTSGAATRLGAGSALTVLTSNGAGVAPSWQASSGGGGGGTGLAGSGIVPIQVIGPLASTQASVTFSVPQTYRSLRISFVARASAASGNEQLLLRMNGDSGATNYDSIISDQGGVADVSKANLSALYCGYVANASHAAGVSSSGEIWLQGYQGTTYFKSVETAVRVHTLNRASKNTGTWKNTAAVTSLTLLPEISAAFDVGTYFVLWGELDAAPTLPASQSSLIQEVVLGAAAATISLANIPQTYRDLRLFVQGRSDAVTAFTNLLCQINGDTGTNYAWERILLNGNSQNVVQGLTQATMLLGELVGTSATSASMAGMTDAVIGNYTTTSFIKQINWRNGVQSSLASAGMDVTAGTSYWNNTAAITSILLSLATGNFAAGTVVRLYGEPATSLPKIAEVVLSAAQATISFTGIPQTYRQLELNVQARGDAVAVSVDMSLQFNGDTTASYDEALMTSNAGGGSTATGTVGGTAARIATISAASATAGAAADAVVEINNYTGTTFRKSFVCHSNVDKADSATSIGVETRGLVWRNTAAITSIVAILSSGNFVAGSVFTLYGKP